MNAKTGLLLTLATFATFAACAASEEVADDTTEDGAGAAGPGGAGGAPSGCTTDTECDDAEACTTDTCGAEGECAHTPVAAGPLPDQTAGDCVSVGCEAGAKKDTPDDTDLPDDGNGCTVDACVRGVPQNTAEPPGTACTDGGGVLCNGDRDAPACVECNTPSNCTALPADTACQTRTCTAGTCGQTFAALGTPIAQQTDGDCKVSVCDGAGAIVQDNDDADVPADGNDCTLDVCTAGVPSNPLQPIDTPCGMQMNLVCNATGTCVGCNSPAQCPPSLTCQTATCTNGQCGVANLPNGTVCDDGQYCNGADSCNFGSCAVHPGNPCTPGDGDGDCSETCDEATDSCTGPDPAGSPCSDGLFCTALDTCDGAGVCTSSGNPCPGNNVGPECNDSCNEATDLCNGADPDGTPCAGGVCTNGTCPCPAQLPGFSGVIGPDFSSSCWRQCEGYLDNVSVDDIPPAWGNDCMGATFNKVRIVCGTGPASYRYIDVNKNVFKDGLASYPETGLIIAAQNQNGVPFSFANEIYATGNHPHVQQSWWGGGQGCGEANTNLTVNNICTFDASNCFGQNIAGSRYLYVYVKE